MKFKRIITKEIQMDANDLEEKIDKYLKKNYYRIIEKGPGYIIFANDDFSDRKTSRSDIYVRIGEGKFLFHSSAEQQTTAKLIYLTSITFPLSLMVLISAFGIYTKSFAPIILSFVFTIPIIFRIFYLKGNVFKEILEC